MRQRGEIGSREGMDFGRLARKSASSLSYTVLVVAAVALSLGISLNLRQRWDLSRGGGNTLSPQTEEVLSNLDEDVEIYPLFTSNNLRREPYRYLLQRYRDASSHISVEFIDPVAQPGAVKDLGLDPTEGNSRREEVTVVMRNERKILFQGTDEENVTNAILDVGSADRRVVGFLRGYGERDPSSKQGRGIALAVKTLSQEYYELADVFLANGIPSEVSVLVAAGLRMPISGEDLERLAAWLEDGGRLLVLTDPGPDVGLNSILERWGLRATGDLVFEPKQNVNHHRQFVLVTSYSQHHIVSGFGSSLPSGFPVVTPVEHFEPGDPLVFHDDLAFTTNFALSKGGDGTRKQGPFTLAAASWRREKETEKETRVVLVGDSDFVSNEYLPYRANQNFFLNCVGWLSREKSLVSIRRQKLAGQVLDLDQDDSMILLAAYGAPSIVVIAGVLMFFRRRRL